MERRILPLLALVLFGLQLLLMLLSWVLAAAFPLAGIHSLLSGEGLRWFLGYLTHQLATPYLVWLLLVLMAGGCLWDSGLLTHRRTVRSSKATYRERRALVFSVLWLVFFVGFILLLTVMPHAVLLSATGHLWPSPFSSSILPVTAFGILMAAVIYGLVSGHFASIVNVYDSLLHGLRWGAPLLLFYVLAVQFYCSLLFVLS